jgi:hypothetical protein
LKKWAGNRSRQRHRPCHRIRCQLHPSSGPNRLLRRRFPRFWRHPLRSRRLRTCPPQPWRRRTLRHLRHPHARHNGPKHSATGRTSGTSLLPTKSSVRPGPSWSSGSRNANPFHPIP